MAALLCAKDLCKTYVIDKRQNNVLKNVNLEVKEGEMVAIMGPSGCRFPFAGFTAGIVTSIFSAS